MVYFVEDIDESFFLFDREVRSFYRRGIRIANSPSSLQTTAMRDSMFFDGRNLEIPEQEQLYRGALLHDLMLEQYQDLVVEQGGKAYVNTLWWRKKNKTPVELPGKIINCNGVSHWELLVHRKIWPKYLRYKRDRRKEGANEGLIMRKAWRPAKAILLPDGPGSFPAPEIVVDENRAYRHLL